MSFSYDQSRKQQSTIRHRSNNPLGAANPQSQYVGIPYNFEFGLSVYARNIEDSLQILEQILPFFTPDYTLTAQVSEEVKIIKDIPIILKEVSDRSIYEGEFSSARLITWDLSFSMKGWLFGPVSNTAIIMGVTSNAANANATTGGVYVNIYEDVNNKTLQKVVLANGITDFRQTEPMRAPLRNITGTVYDWANTTNTIYFSDMTGVLSVGESVWGLETGAHWTVLSVETVPKKEASIWITQKPITANQYTDYGYSTTIKEFPNA